MLGEAVMEKDLRHAYRKILRSFTNTVDSALCSALLSLKAMRSTIENIMMHHPSASSNDRQLALPKELPSLLSAVEATTNGQEETLVFSEDICVEIHRLLVAMLFGLGMTLRQLHTVKKNNHGEK